MLKRYIKRSCSVINKEIYSGICLLIGTIKSRCLFDKHATNKLEIGIGGTEKKLGFITSDLDLNTDYPYDLCFGLPFPDNSIDLIYAEHVLEHFNYRDLANLLKDCHRVLKPDGIFSVTVPNAKIYLTAYQHPEEFNKLQYCVHDCGLSYRSPIDFVNYMFYMDGHHRHMFDEKNIITIFDEIGFRNIHSRDFDPALDRYERKHESIYAECTK